MNLFNKFKFVIALIVIINLTFAPLAFPKDSFTTTKIIVLKGKVACFDLPKGFESIEKRGETAIGKISDIINEEICIVIVNKKKNRCFVPQEYRILFQNKLLPGAEVYLVKNIRRAKQTDWDIISVASLVGPLQEFSNGIISEAEISESLQAVSDLAKEQTISITESGTGSTSTNTAPTITNPSSIPTTDEIKQAEKEQDETFPNPTPAPETTPSELTITTDSALSGGSEGTAYSTTLSASGGTSPYSWSITSGSLPGGLSLSSGGVISGTPSGNMPGNTYSFTVRVTDSVSSTASKSLGIKISGTVTADWARVSTNGFGSANNTYAFTSNTFGNYIYASTRNTVTGGEIWRSSDGTTWGCVVGPGGTIGSGFGSANNIIIYFTITFNNYIYAGTYNFTTGGQVWRSQDGATWAQANTSGFGNVSNLGVYSASVFNNYLYVGVTNLVTGCQIWRSSDGTTWEQVNANGFGSANNWIAERITVFGGYIYAGTYNTTTGGQIWRSSTGDSGSWAQANTSGFGSITNTRITYLGVFSNYIYATTANSTTGSQLWRSSDGTNWTQIIGNGFGSTSNVNAWGLTAFGSYFYITTYNSSGSGGQVWRSQDGTTWAQITNNGFGDTNNSGFIYMVQFGDYLYTGTINSTNGGQVWRYYEAYIDPAISGRIYDSETGENVPGAVASIYPKNSTTALQTSTTNPYSFNVLDGYYYIRIEKEGYTFPSNDKNGVTAGDHGEVFYASGTTMSIDIPLDQGYPLEITKTANKVNVVNGDIVTYDIKIRNNSMWSYPNINIVDEITNGFKYVDESTYTDDTQFPETNVGISDRNATFKLKNIPGYKVTHLTYQVRIGTGISPGEYKTKAVAWDRQRDWQMSNETKCQVNVIYDTLFTLGTIIGKVFYDANGNGIQDPPSPNPLPTGERTREAQERGIAGVRIATEYGVVVETDRYGKYHIAAVPPGTHLLKVDSSSLPDDELRMTNYKFTTENPYLVKITDGLLAKVNFGINEGAEAEKSKTRNTPSNPETVIPLSKINNTESDGAKGASILAKSGTTNIKPRNKDNRQSTTNSELRTPNSELKEILDQFFIVALGEGIVSNINTSGNIAMVEQDDTFDKGVNVDGRLALYLKGKILGKYLVTASVDTDRSPSRRGRAYQMRKLFTNLDPDKYYPVYGDASKIDYSANDTQDELYLLVQWDKSLIKYGAFNTNIPLYSRTIQGANIVYENIKQTKYGDPYTKINTFYARAYQIAAHDEFLGTGGSLYYIRHTPLIEGSEKVRVELRDELSKEVIGTKGLIEQQDYEIDYDTGKIILKKPLASVNYNYAASIISNDILSGSRAYLVIDYEYENTSSMRKEAYGIKANQWVGDHVNVGGTYIEEQKESQYYKLMGGDGTIKLNKDTEITAEYDRSEQTQLSGSYSINGGLSYDTLSDTANNGKSGSAFNVKGKTRLFNNTAITAGYTRQDKNFSATNTISTNGTDVYTASIYTKLSQILTAGVKYVGQQVKDATLAEDLTGNNRVHTTTASLDYLPNKWDMRLEYQHQTVNNSFIDYTYAGFRQLMPWDVIGGRIGYKLTDKLHPYIGGQITVQNFVNNQGYVGLEYQIWDNTYLRIKETQSNLGNSTQIGLVSQITPETEAYTNIEIGNNAQLGEDGKFIKTTTGQKTKLDKDTSLNWEKDYSSYQSNILQGDMVGYEKKLSDTFSIGLSYERAFIEKEPTAISRDSGSIALTYLDIDHIKAFSKLELRQDRGKTSDTVRQWLTTNNILYQLNQDISLIGKADWSITDDRTAQSTEAQFHEMGVGMAYRPVNFDKLNFLAKYSYITNQSPESQNDFFQTTEDTRNIYAIEGAYDIIKYLQLVGKFAMRDMSEKVGPRGWTDSETYLCIGRLNFHITNKWDVSAEYRTLANRQIEDSKSGWLVEVDRELIKYINLGVGYNFTDYDDDLSNDDNYDASGWFVRVNGKY